MEQDAPDASSGFTLEVILGGLSKGTVLYKVKSLDTFYRKKYRIDMETMRLKYSPSSKKLFCSTLPHVDLNEIEEIRRGWKSDFFCKVEEKYRRKLHWKLSPLLNENCCLSIVLGPTYETIDLLAPNTETRDVWFRGLTHLVASCKCINREQQRERWLKQQFQKADTSNNGSLSFNECMTLLHNMNLEMDRRQVEKLFKEANFRKSKHTDEEGLDMDEFLAFYQMLNARPELESLFKRYCVNETKVMGPEQLCQFLREEQKMMSVTVDSCKQMIERFEKDKDLLAGFLSYKGFREMMLSKEQDIFNKDHRAIHQDMSLPLTNYYISTSHNTYLTEGQLMGTSSVEGYIKVLKRGVRCVELDLWDGPGGEPVVYHGYTLTSKIYVRDALEAIRDYLFVASQFPVILSLENHCSVEQQNVVADHISTILSNYLYKEPIGKDESQLPSPEALARKVLVKAKKIHDENLEESEEDEPEPEPDEPQKEKNVKLKISQKLSDLVNYCKAVSFKTFREVFETRSFNEMSSFEEVKADHLIETDSDDFIRYNQTHLSRIYPKGTRVESSNMDPSTYWNVGCHMVALNCQKDDLGMLMHCGRFMENGECGYVLKPEFLRNGECSLDEIPSKTKKKTLTIKVISGQYLPRPGQSETGEVVDPYVTFTIYGHPLDKQRRRTTYISNNGFNPHWNETLVFDIKVPELALILVHVKDNNNFGENLTLAQYAIPFNSITQGYRHIHLWNTYMEELPLSGLFVHVTITDG